MEVMKPSCEKCMFSTPTNQNNKFECHRNPPQVLVGQADGPRLAGLPDMGPQVVMQPYFPPVAGAMWCGEFKPMGTALS